MIFCLLKLPAERPIRWMVKKGRISSWWAWLRRRLARRAPEPSFAPRVGARPPRERAAAPPRRPVPPEVSEPPAECAPAPPEEAETPARLPLSWEEVDAGLRERLEERLGILDELPLLTVKLVAKLEDPDTDPRDVAKLASTNPAIASEIFRIVNSAFFGLREPVTTLQRAILFLGYTRVKFLVSRLGMQDATPQTPESRRRTAEIWRHSFLTCEALRAIASRCPGLDPNEAHTAALLHDLGKLLLIDLALHDDLAPRLEAENHTLPMEERVLLEDDTFGVNHCTLGAQLGLRLKLPAPVRTVQRYHHHPLDALPRETAAWRPLIAGVRLASRLAHDLELDEGETPDRDLAPYRTVFPRLPDYATLRRAAAPPLEAARSFLASLETA